LRLLCCLVALQKLADRVELAETRHCHGHNPCFKGVSIEHNLSPGIQRLSKGIRARDGVRLPQLPPESYCQGPRSARRVSTLENEATGADHPPGVVWRPLRSWDYELLPSRRDGYRIPLFIRIEKCPHVLT